MLLLVQNGLTEDTMLCVSCVFASDGTTIWGKLPVKGSLQRRCFRKSFKINAFSSVNETLL